MELGKIVPKLFSIFSGLVECVEYILECDLSKEIAHLGPIRADRELKTIATKLPRRMGNTTLAIMLLSYFKQCYLIGPTHMYCKDLIFRMMENQRSEISEDQKSRIIPISEVERCTFHRHENPIILIDPAHIIKAQQIEEIYANHPRAGCYVLLG